MNDTIDSVVIMAVAGIAGFFAGMYLNEPIGGAILFALIAGIACVVHAIEKQNKEQ